MEQPILPIDIHDMPIELIKIIVESMNGQTWLKFRRSSKYYNSILTLKKDIYEKLKDAQREQYDKSFRTIIKNGIKYYRPDKDDNKDMHIYCNDCSACLKLANLTNHLNACRIYRPLICNDCGIPTPFHKLVGKKCMFCFEKCKYCVESIILYEKDSHELMCGELLKECNK